jgi:transposase
MAKQRPTYSPEFQKDTAELVLDKGYSIPEASQATGGLSAVRRWVNQLHDERGGKTQLLQKQ